MHTYACESWPGPSCRKSLSRSSSAWLSSSTSDSNFCGSFSSIIALHNSCHVRSIILAPTIALSMHSKIALAVPWRVSAHLQPISELKRGIRSAQTEICSYMNFCRNSAVCGNQNEMGTIRPTKLEDVCVANNVQLRHDCRQVGG